MEEQNLIDVNIGVENCGGMEDFYIEIAQMFLDQQEEKVTSLNGYLSEENWKDYEVLVHALKTNGRTIGAMPFGEISYELELLAKKVMNGEDVDASITEIKAKHPLWIQMYADTARELEEIISDIE